MDFLQVFYASLSFSIFFILHHSSTLQSSKSSSSYERFIHMLAMLHTLSDHFFPPRIKAPFEFSIRIHVLNLWNYSQLIFIQLTFSYLVSCKEKDSIILCIKHHSVHQTSLCIKERPKHQITFQTVYKNFIEAWNTSCVSRWRNQFLVTGIDDNKEL